MAVESFEAGVDRKHLIGPDLVSELRDLIEAGEEVDIDQWRALRPRELRQGTPTLDTRTV